MADERRRIGKYRAARSVIPMIMAIQHIAYRNAKPGLDFTLEPLGKIGIDRVGQDHAVRSD
jgi:hypothetical protein